MIYNFQSINIIFPNRHKRFCLGKDEVVVFIMCTRIVIVLVLAFVSGTLARNLLKELQSDNTHPCKAENLKFAATYICDKNGKIHCQTGWKEPNRNQTLEHIGQYNPCSEPICDPVCQYGRCVEPNICACEVGWFGNTCSECIPLAGCIHGGCQQAFECNCDLGKDKKTNGKYTGTHCDIRKENYMRNMNTFQLHIILQLNATIVFMVHARNLTFARKLLILNIVNHRLTKFFFKVVTMDGKEKHVMNVLHYQDVPMGVVRDHPILVNVTKVGKVICVMNPFVLKDVT